MVVKKRSHAEVAIAFNVTSRLVGRLIRDFRKQDDPATKRKLKEDEKLAKVVAVKAEIQRCIEAGQNIWRREQIVDAVRLAHGVDVKDDFVSKVMRQGFQMRYRKIKKVAFQGNSDRSLIIRQQFAKRMLGLLS